MGHVVIATDGSPTAGEAIREGLHLASHAGAGVTFVTVCHPVRTDRMEWERKADERLSGADEALKAALEEAERLGVEADSDIRWGDPAEEIIRAAQGLEADTIVVGSRGLGALTGALRGGSVSRALVRHSPVPVLVVNRRTVAAREAVGTAS